MSVEGNIRAFIRNNPQSVRVEVTRADGSTPRERGAWMLVSPATTYQTIGGGQLEYMAIDKARAMLRDAVGEDIMSIPLGPEIGQCCGGRVEIGFTVLDEALAEACVRQEDQALLQQPQVYLFGAGHVGIALARALDLLPVSPIVVDTRKPELEKVPAGIETCLTAVPESLVREAPPGSAFVILTHDHSLDFLIASEALARNDVAYCGMIGSKTKRASLRSWYLKNGGEAERLEKLVCPIGGSTSADKRPAVIASFAAAEIMEALGRYAETAMAGSSAERIS